MVAKQVDVLPMAFDANGVTVALLDLDRLGDEELLAASVLHRAEHEQYAELGHPGRRREWLGARACLKQLLLDHGCISEPTHCAIEKDLKGRPSLAFDAETAVGAISDCSLAHKSRFACACASSDAKTRVGVDIEKVSRRLTELSDAFVNPRDTAASTRSDEERLTVLWALKEACAKAVGEGLAIGLSTVVCSETAPGFCRLKCQDGAEFAGSYVFHEGYVVALCTMTRA
jgi:phosphopantetheinyl transferase